MPISYSIKRAGINLNADGKGEGRSYKEQYIVKGEDDASLMLSGLYALVKSRVVFGLYLSDLSADEYYGNGKWLVTATFEPWSVDNAGSSQEETEKPQISFDCTASSVHIDRALGDGQDILIEGSPDPGLLIGWNGEFGEKSEVKGCDVFSAQGRESYTKMMKITDLDVGYRKMLFEYTGCVNSHTFADWLPGEVLFMGANFGGAIKGNDRIKVTFNFAIRPTQTITVGTTSVIKLGWAYLWNMWESNRNTTTGKVIPEIKGIYMAKVYEYKNFNNLGIF